jgi:predicted transcriptional regulator of viral defense system
VQYPNIRSLTPAEAKLVLTLIERGRDAFNRTDAADILGTTPHRIKDLLRDLTAKGWLERLGGGRYLLVPPAYGAELTGEYNVLALASASVSEGYVGWWNAASLHGFTTQVPSTVTMATPRRHRSRVLAGSEVRYITIPLGRFFGFENREVFRRSVTVSDREKTVIDCIDRPDLCGGLSEICRIVWGAAADLNWQRLLQYVERIESVSIAQRLGFLCDLVKAPIPANIRHALYGRLKWNSRSRFGPENPVDGAIGFVADWKLTVNSAQRELLSDVPRKIEKAL